MPQLNHSDPYVAVAWSFWLAKKGMEVRPCADTRGTLWFGHEGVNGSVFVLGRSLILYTPCNGALGYVVCLFQLLYWGWRASGVRA